MAATTENLENLENPVTIVCPDYTNPQVWDENTVMAQLPLVKSSLAIIIDWGNEDFIHGVNERLHREMEYRRIKHDYTSHPGIHDFDYRNLSIPHHFQFF